MTSPRTSAETPAGTPARSQQTDDSGKWRYGVTVVLAGLAVIFASFWLAIIEYSKAADVSTALAPITGVIGTIVGAYFGVQTGSAGKEKAEDARDKAETQAKAALAIMPRENRDEIQQFLY